MPSLRLLRSALDDLAVLRSFRHLHGPRRVQLRPDQAGLVLLARNVEWFLPAFLAHHRAIGVSHFLVVDNGSTDRTVDIANQPDVTVIRSVLPVKKHEIRLRALAARRLFRDGWVLFADADEMVELPFATPLKRLLDYCNGRRFTAVIGQMLDLYAPAPTVGADYAAAIRESTSYSLGMLDRIGYADPTFPLHWLIRDNRSEDPGVTFLQGGLRREVFGENPLLTKHSLVRNAPPAQIMTHPHCANRVTVADVTLALRHYKLAGDWAARDRANVRSTTWDHNEDVRRLQASARPDFAIRPAAPRQWRGTAALVEEGFLHASSSARAALADPAM